MHHCFVLKGQIPTNLTTCFLQGAERAAEAVHRQPGDPQVLPLHEGRQGRPGRADVRARVRGLRPPSGHPRATAHGHHLQRHKQARPSPQTGLLNSLPQRATGVVVLAGFALVRTMLILLEEI